MNTDYRKLCYELFNTDDEKELRKIAADWKARNQRNAGRKKMFSDGKIEELKALQKEGATIQQIAAQYNTSRQVVSKYLSEGPHDGCSLRLTYMYRQHPCTVVDLDFLNQKAYVRNMTNDVLHRAFGINENPDWEDVEQFLVDRCFPKTRGNRKKLLEDLGLSDYDPLQIIEKTRGRMADDDLWVKTKNLVPEAIK